jgi:hypothetical protein
MDVEICKNHVLNLWRGGKPLVAAATGKRVSSKSMRIDCIYTPYTRRGGSHTTFMIVEMQNYCMQFMSNVSEKLSAHTYPATTTELIDAYGNLEFDTDDTESFGEVMGRLGETTFHDSEGAQQAALSAMGEGAIGRKGYSDRDAPAVGEQSDAELLSF